MYDYPFLFYETLLVLSVYKINEMRYNVYVSSPNKLKIKILEETKMTVKNLFENEELMEAIVEDIEDIPEDTEVFYAVFALGYDAEDEYTDDEVLIGEFTDPDEAVACAEKATIEQINELGFGKPDPNTAYFSIEVETVIADHDDEDGGTMNIGTIYSRDLEIDG
jgi:hypothetical protein